MFSLIPGMHENALCNVKNVSMTSKFVSYRLCPSGVTHIDTFKPSLTKDSFKERTCNVCLSMFANKTQKENHRRAVHPRNLGREIEDEDLKIEDVGSFDVIDEGAIKIVGERNGLYCMLYDEYTQWVSLSDDNEFVQDWRDDLPLQALLKDVPDQLPLIDKDDLRKWLTSNVNTADCFVEKDLFD